MRGGTDDTSDGQTHGTVALVREPSAQGQADDVIREEHDGSGKRLTSGASQNARADATHGVEKDVESEWNHQFRYERANVMVRRERGAPSLAREINRRGNRDFDDDDQAQRHGRGELCARRIFRADLVRNSRRRRGAETNGHHERERVRRLVNRHRRNRDARISQFPRREHDELARPPLAH